MSKLKQIRPNLGFAKFMDNELLGRASFIHSGMTGNPAYPNPPVDAAAFRAAIDSYAAAIAEALDGSRRAIADRQKKREDVIAMLRLLGPYVESTCKGDMTTFLSSGFEAASTARSAPQQLSQPNIVRIDQGNTGQLLVNIKAVPKARNYELRYVALGSGPTSGTPETTQVAAAKQAVAINNLTPGTTYTFQVRAFGKLGYTDWSSSVSRMSI